MNRSNDSFAPLVNYSLAALAVALMLLGRWSPERLFTSLSIVDMFWLVKGGLLFALGIVVVLPGRSSTKDGQVPAMLHFVMLMTYVVASYLWNPAPAQYANSKIADLGYNVLLVLVVAFGLQQAALRRPFWVVLVSALGIMALIGVVTLPTAVATYDQGRLAVLGGGPNIFGRNMGLLIVAGLYFGVNYARVRVASAVLIGSAALGLIASGSRGSLGATIIALILLCALDPGCRRFIFARPLLMAGFAVSSIGVALLVDFSAVAKIGSERFLEQTVEGRYLSYRDVLLQYAYDFWLEAPAFGNGLGSFSLVTPLDYPHNILMEFLCETGLVGLLLFLVFAATGGWAQARSPSPARAMIISVIALMGISALVSGDFVDFRFLYLFLLYPVVGAGGSIKFKLRSASRALGRRDGYG